MAVDLGISRAALFRGGRLPGKELDLQRRHDRAGDLLLHGEHVREIALECLRPEMRTAARLDQLGGDPDAISRFADTAFEQIRSAEFLADGAEIVVPGFE